MMDEITYTHKGWFGLCPVYVSEPGWENEAIEARYPWTDWLIDLSAWACGNGWPLRVTGELEDPFVVEYER